jgi:hypothetical protein
MMKLLLVPAPLRDRLGDVASEGLMDMFAAAHERAVESFERRLSEEVSKLRAEMHVGFADLKSELLKWSFLFWIGQLAAVAGLLSVLR